MSESVKNINEKKEQKYDIHSEPVLKDALIMFLKNENLKVSVSLIQRKFQLGYARACRLIDLMEHYGFVSEFDGSKGRMLLITPEKFEEIFGEKLN